MNFLNLGLGELLGLIGVVSAGVTALYLLDRSKKRQVVATLRFWTPAGSRTELKHRRKIQQPWSLLLELISLILLLLAIAGPQFGIFDGPGRDHVLVLDTSAWMGSTTAQGTVLDQAKTAARAYLRTLPRRDRVMLLHADALATPATSFERDHNALETALQDSQAGASSFDLALALDFAERAQALQGSNPGEIVVISSGRIDTANTALSHTPKNLRFIPVNVTSENLGLTKVALRRAPSAPDTWEIFVAVHNYGLRPHNVDLAVQYAQSPIGNRRLALQPGADEQVAFTYKEKIGGWLEARLNVNDSIPGDNRAVVEVPSQGQLKAVVYSNDPALRPLFQTNPSIEAEFRSTSEYNADTKADFIVLDRFAPATPPAVDTIFIQPPSNGSPIPVKSTVTRAPLERWSTDSALATGIYTRDVVLDSAEVFNPTPTDKVIASTNSGPVIVAREGAAKYLAIGFLPDSGSMKFELATPLLIANALRWMSPGTYGRLELNAGSVGTITVPIDAATDPATIHILDEQNNDLPFTIEGRSLRFFAGSPTTVRVQTGDRELIYSLTLPALAESTWTAPQGISKGVPPTSLRESAATEIWPWLAIAGALGLLADWILFGRNQITRLSSPTFSTPWRKAS